MRYPKALMWMRLALPAVMVTLATCADAQESLDLDPSVRSSGMGGACNAVFWGRDPDDWANPALLGYASGARYSLSRTQLLPSLAQGIFFRTQRLAVGGGGVGVGIPGNLNGYGSALLNYGTLPSPFEEVRSWGLGVSLSELAATALHVTRDDAPAILRYGDVALGLNDKHVRFSYGPVVEGNTRDYGLLLRATPVNQLEGRPRLPLRIDLSYGKSRLNYNGELLPIYDAYYPTSRISRNGVGAHAVLGMTESMRERLGRRDWLIRSLSPLVSIGLAGDWEHVTAGGGEPGYRVRRYGGEMSVVNVLHVRLGHVTDRTGDIDGGASGWGLGFNLGDFLGLRYDRASIPQAPGLPRVKRKGVSMFVDLLRVADRRVSG